MAVNNLNDPLLRALKSTLEQEQINNAYEGEITPNDMGEILDADAAFPQESALPQYSDPEKEYMRRALEQIRMAPGGFGAPVEELPPLPQKIIPVQEINDVNRQFLDETLNTGVKSAPPTGGKRFKEEKESASGLGPGYKNYQKQKQEKRKLKKEKK